VMLSGTWNYVTIFNPGLPDQPTRMHLEWYWLVMFLISDLPVLQIPYVLKSVKQKFLGKVTLLPPVKRRRSYD